jgi:hypothetical protein
LIPVIVTVGHIPPVGVAAWFVTVGAGVEHVLGQPVVEDWLADFVPWLASTPTTAPPAA